MSDDRIIDFNELKNKVKETDIDKFENYMYNMYFSVADGSMTMAQFTSKIYDYMRENNISNEKFMNMQKKLLERYGVDESEIERQLKNMGINPNDLSSLSSMNINDIRNNNINLNNNKPKKEEPKVEFVPVDNIQETIVKNSDFYNKFATRLEYDSYIVSKLKNDVNDLKIIINKERVTLMSEGAINLVDSQLNEFLLDYKNMIGKKMKVTICENCKEYDY
ncbi:DUF3867 domain-containing protein [Intestinibacter bartlettii]|uniref:DUF3867 domain-containing protein n=1 Tax=Intestinibacter bartlettii TaxID=261299 RepID=A0ABS6DSS2_9FIRM|nr:DUF3867 domain-containing protein [Intestinibacter bartlettii]MBU5334883.1 DUF3867 domain-containing protein [Intestinibacter bartlettii]MDO5011251.1 DUF3867 domain-containing protein [Intestinibacter bartlettii]